MLKGKGTKKAARGCPFEATMRQGGAKSNDQGKGQGGRAMLKGRGNKKSRKGVPI